MRQGARTPTQKNPELAPLSPVPTAVVPTLAPEPRAEMRTPTSEVDFVLPPPGRPRTTAPSMRVPETTNKFSRFRLRYDTRTLSIIGGAAFGVVLAVTIWLLVR